MSKILLCVLALSFVSLVQWTGNQKDQFIAKVSIPSSTLSLEDQLILSLDLTYPKQYHPDLSAIKKNLSTTRSFGLFPFVIQHEKENPVQSTANGSLTQHVEFVLEPILTGNHTLTFFNIPFIPNEQGTLQTETIISDVFTINVSSPQVNENYKGTIAPLMDFSTPYPVEMTPENRKKFLENPEVLKKLESLNAAIMRNKSLPWAGIVCLFLSFLFVWVSRQPSKTPKAQSAISAKTAFSKAQAIGQIDSWQQKIDEGTTPAPKDFQALTNIFKDYLKEKHLLPAKSFTTEETLNYTMSRLTLPQKEKERIKEILLLSDQVKFANARPSSNEWKNTLLAVKELLQSEEPQGKA